MTHQNEFTLVIEVTWKRNESKGLVGQQLDELLTYITQALRPAADEHSFDFQPTSAFIIRVSDG